MIEWGNFVLVLIATLVASCATIALFSLGLRFAGPGADGPKPLGIACFVLCAMVILYGFYLVIPFFHQ